MWMLEVVTSVVKRDLPAKQLFLMIEIITNDLETDEEMELPYLKCRFRRGVCGAGEAVAART